jgi:hypothetical protein
VKVYSYRLPAGRELVAVGVLVLVVTDVVAGSVCVTTTKLVEELVVVVLVVLVVLVVELVVRVVEVVVGVVLVDDVEDVVLEDDVVVEELGVVHGPVAASVGSPRSQRDRKEGAFHDMLTMLLMIVQDWTSWWL